MSDRDTVRQALYDAIDWQTSLADAYGRNDPERAEANQQAKKYRSLLKRRYRQDKTPMEALGESCESVSIDKLAQAPISEDLTSK